MTCSEIRDIRIVIGVTQEQFARLIGVSCPSVQRWERGVSRPSPLHLDILNLISENTSKIKGYIDDERGTGSDIDKALFQNDFCSPMLYMVRWLANVIFGRGQK